MYDSFTMSVNYVLIKLLLLNELKMLAKCDYFAISFWEILAKFGKMANKTQRAA